VTTARLDRVLIFGDQLSSLIPHEWIEGEEEPDHYLYHLPNVDSGWFRVSLITLKASGKASKEQLRALLAEKAQKEQGSLCEVGDNIVVAWEELSEEDGVPICNYWWAVGRSHGPNLGHEALFSYTVLREHREDSETQETVSLLAGLVADATLAAPKIA
jgi:hypothetical protein